MAASQAARLAELRLESRNQLSVTTVRAIGLITFATSVSLEHTLRGLIPKFNRIVLDVSKVDYIDSSGLGVLASVYMQARKTNCHLEIANPKPRLRDVLRSWLHSVFEGHEQFLGMTPD